MYVIDAHVHVWEANNDRHHWLPEAVRALHSDPMPVERVIAAMDAIGVDGAVLVVARLDGFDNGYALESAMKFPDRLAVVGRIDSDDPSSCDAIKTWRTQFNMVGFRMLMMTDADLAVLDRAGPLLRAAEGASVPLCLYPVQSFDRLPALVEQYPSLQFVIDHLGLDHHGSAEHVDQRVGQVVQLARHPNVAVKLSAAPLHSALPYPFDDMWRTIDRILGAFGVARTIWGSDTTVTSSDHTYHDALSYIRCTDRLSHADKEMLLGGSLRSIFRWEPSGRHPASHSSTTPS
jgi:L-fuconolactonase